MVLPAPAKSKHPCTQTLQPHGTLTLDLYSAPKAGSLLSGRWIPEPPAGKENVCWKGVLGLPLHSSRLWKLFLSPALGVRAAEGWPFPTSKISGEVCRELSEINEGKCTWGGITSGTSSDWGPTCWKSALQRTWGS